MLNKIEYLKKHNNPKLLIFHFISKECYLRNYQNKEMKNRDVYNDKLDKLKKAYENETENENDHF